MIDDATITARFWTNAVRFADGTVDGHVTSLHCQCGTSFYAENPWMRGARDHIESGDCPLGIPDE